MKPIPLIGGSYQSRAVPADGQRTINLTVEADPNGGEKAILVGGPALVPEFTLPTMPIRGSTVMNGRSFHVGGATLYETTSGTPVALGTLQTATGTVSMPNDDTTILLVDGVAGYTFTGTTFAVIADPDFPNGVTRAAWEGQFFIVGCDGTKRFFISDLATGSSWNGLDFASAENKPEILVSLIISHDRLMLFTLTGSEQWVNTGNAEFAFERDNGSSAEVGCEARDSVVTMNNGVYWLGCDKDGGGMVFAHQGGVAQRISTHALEHTLQAAARSDAYAIAYQQEGHAYYCLTVPSLERTFCYDSAAPADMRWTDRAYWDAERGVYTRWRPVTHAFVGGRHLVGDYATGDVYRLSLEVSADRWMRRTAPIKAALARLFYSMLEIDMEVGISPTGQTSVLMMRYSDDGGRTWSGVREMSIGAEGMTRARVRFPRCGSGRNRVFEFSGTDQYRPTLFGAYADLSS